jgi:hypothetical protein
VSECWFVTLYRLVYFSRKHIAASAYTSQVRKVWAALPRKALNTLQADRDAMGKKLGGNASGDRATVSFP